MISQDPSCEGVRGVTDWGMALNIFYENETLGAAAAKVGVDWQVVACVSGHEIGIQAEHLEQVSAWMYILVQAYSREVLPK